MVMPILSRAWYENQGFVFFPEYESMFADNDFCETARQAGVVIDARHLMFPHRHPMFQDGKWSRDWKSGGHRAARAEPAAVVRDRGRRSTSGARL